MTHYSRISMVVIDVDTEDHDATVAFWGSVIGRELKQSDKFPEYHGADVVGCGDLGLLVQHLGDGPARVHLDIHTDDMPAEVARLGALGAVVDREAHHWTVMRDPAGLAFCVIPDPPGTLTDANAQRWD